MVTARVALFNVSPMLKRAVWFDPVLYAAATFLPLLLLLGRRIRRSAIFFLLLISAALIIYSWRRGAPEYEIAIFLIVYAFSPYFAMTHFDLQLRALRPLLFISAAYGLWQLTYGYADFELAWISSGLGRVSEQGYFVTESIRPFSLFAGVPEFAFFISIFLYYFYRHRSLIGQLFCVAMLIAIGSRGVLVATLTAYAFLLTGVANWRSRSAILSAAVTAGVLVYVAVFLLYPVYIQPYVAGATSRLVVFGTLNARIQLLADILTNLQLEHLAFGQPTYISTADNMFLFLLFNYGAVSLVAFLAFAASLIKDQKSAYFVCLLLGYCLYADVLLSVFFMFNFFLAALSNGTHPIRSPETSPG